MADVNKKAIKLFAAPGTDSDPSEWGVYNSGAGLHPTTRTAKEAALPWDWFGLNPWAGRATGRLIGNYPQTGVKNVSANRVYRRGWSLFGGTFDRFKSGKVKEKSGGIVDTNLGADHKIAGGHGQAATLVRVNGPRKNNEGQKLPVLPRVATRRGPMPLPVGGSVGAYGAPAPVLPKIYGFPGVIKVLMRPQEVK